MLKPYKEGQEYKKPTKSKDGYFYDLYWSADEKQWIVDCIKKPHKAYDESFAIDETCWFKNYKDAWEFTRNACPASTSGNRKRKSKRRAWK